MKKLLWVSGLVWVLAAPALADIIYYPPQITGARYRKNLRHDLYVKNLTGDKLDVYQEYGFPVHRVRENGYGQVREHWFYYEAGTEFVFNQCGDLVDTKGINEEHRRLWAYQYDVHGYDEAMPCDE
jgi:hypothetical protein